MANNPDVRGCRSCGRNLNIAGDQTDWPPRENEVALDTAHMSPEPSHHDYYVCGRCIEKAEAYGDAKR